MRSVGEPAPASMPALARGPAFEALHYRELLQIVNPHGDVGFVTLWSPLRTARRKLEGISSDLLDGERSRIAVMSNLYGDGLFAMFANLLNNPQVKHLVAIGEDLGLSTCQEIEAFLADGLEDVEMLGKPMKRIRGTERLFPQTDGFDEAALRQRLSFRAFGKLSRPELPNELLEHLNGLPVARGQHEPRQRVMLPVTGADQFSHRPSQVNAHNVLRARPLDCWQELVVRTMRFGRPVELRNGPRLELLNVKAVVTAPGIESETALARYGFHLEALRAYQERIMDPQLPENIAYTYGNRLRDYFDQGTRGRDTLRTVIERLRGDLETRRAYISLWDTTVDLEGEDADTAKPCMTTLFFRRSEDKLSLTATYRSHNLLSGWLLNAYGLMAIQRHVADALEMRAGELTVISHSLGIDPRSPRLDLARSVEEGWDRDDDLDRESGKWQLREDPHGYFVVSADPERRTIIAEHRYGGVLIKRYEAERAVTIENEVSADMAVSLVSHAMWLGRELTKKEQSLRAGRQRG